MREDTICALATAAAESGIGIIRISGPEAVQIVSGLVRSRSGRTMDISETHRIRYGFLYDGDEALDEVLILTMRAPRSYTGEDTVEIDCHGGVLMMQKILELVVRQGARPAEPGEFTKRAFLNGRMDLSEAEAVGDIITSENENALKASVRQLRGSVSDAVRKYRAQILEDDAFIEAGLDDPEHISLDGFKDTLKKHTEDILSGVRKLIESAEDGRRLREGIRTVILGKPNAGKSSLLNALVGADRAIVTEIAGTTRDTLEERINLKGISLTIVDTAGIRQTEDVVEKIGVERAMKEARNADLLIYVVDASVPLDSSDETIIAKLQDRKCIVLMNKTDLPEAIDERELQEKTGCPVLPISAKLETGMEALEKKIQDMFFHQELHFNDQVIITNARHKQCLRMAAEALEEVLCSVSMDMPEDFYTIDLMRAYEELGYILGEQVSEDLVNEIFSKFCMGK